MANGQKRTGCAWKIWPKPIRPHRHPQHAGHDRRKRAVRPGTGCVNTVVWHARLGRLQLDLRCRVLHQVLVGGDTDAKERRVYCDT